MNNPDSRAIVAYNDFSAVLWGGGNRLPSLFLVHKFILPQVSQFLQLPFPPTAPKELIARYTSGQDAEPFP